MIYCGIDVALKSSYLYLTDAQGKKIAAGEIPTERAEFKKALARFVKQGLSAILEAGGSTSWIYHALVDMGALVTVVSPSKIKLIAESRRKTDKIDAKILCDLLRTGMLPCPVHMPGKDAKAMRTLLKSRRCLVESRTKLCNSVRGFVRQEGVKLGAKALASPKGWESLLTACASFKHLIVIITSYRSAYLALTASIHEIEVELKTYEEKLADIERLKTIPGVGRMSALTLLSAVDDISRFDSGRKLASYSGLVPSVRASGDVVRHGHITKQGRSEIRATWTQAAHAVALCKGKEARPLQRWFEKIAKRRGYKTAIVALARKLLMIAYHLLKQGEVYDMKRLRRAA